MCSNIKQDQKELSDQELLEIPLDSMSDIDHVEEVWQDTLAEKENTPPPDEEDIRRKLAEMCAILLRILELIEEEDLSDLFDEEDSEEDMDEEGFTDSDGRREKLPVLTPSSEFSQHQ